MVVQYLVRIALTQAEGLERTGKPAPLTQRDVEVGSTLVATTGDIVTVATTLGLLPAEVLDSLMRLISWSVK